MSFVGRRSVVIVVLLVIGVALTSCLTYTPPGQPTPTPVVRPASEAVPAATAGSTIARRNPPTISRAAISVPPSLTTSSGSPVPAPKAVLGASETVFVAKLGAPGPDSVPSAIDHFQRASGTTCDLYVVTFANEHAAMVLRQTCAGAVPPADARLAEAAAFVPADTVAGKTFTTENGEPATMSRSANLSAALPPEKFQDCDGNALPPGTFSVVVTSDGWELAAGTCP